MKFNAFSLVESLVALSILAFVTAACVFVVGGIYAKAQLNMGEVYGLMKQVENGPVANSIMEHEAVSVEKRVVSDREGISLIVVTAKHRSGRTLLETRRLIRNE